MLCLSCPAKDGRDADQRRCKSACLDYKTAGVHRDLLRLFAGSEWRYHEARQSMCVHLHAFVRFVERALVMISFYC